MSIYLHKVKSRWQPGENTVAYYPLETDTKDYSGNSRDGTNNGVTFSDGVGVFNGSSYVSLGTDSWTNIQPNMTINVWFKWNGSGSKDNTVITKSQYCAPSTSACYYSITIHEEDRYLCGGYYNGSDYNIHPLNFRTTSGGSPTLGPVSQSNKWYNVVITNDGTTKKTYIDGALVATETSTSTSTTQSIDTRIGSAVRYNYDSYFNGNISAVIFEDKTWTAEEVEDYYMLTKGDYYTETPWEVNQNTMLYMPMDGDAENKVDGTLGTWSGTETYYTLPNGIKAAHSNSSHYLLTPTVANSTPLTVSCWIYRNSGDPIVRADSTSGTRSFPQIGTGNNVGGVRFHYNGTGYGGEVTIGSGWHNVIGVFGANGIVGYIDGKKICESSFNSYLWRTQQRGIGYDQYVRNVPGDGYYSNLIIESKVWSADEALSYYYQTRNDYIDNPWYPVKECEVQNIYIGWQGGYHPGANTLLYLPLDGDYLDKSSNHNDGTAVGTMSFGRIGNRQYASFGASSAIELGTIPVGTGNPQPFTQSVWLKTTASGVGYMHHFGVDSYHSRSCLITFYSSNHIPLQDMYGSSYDTYIGSATTSDLWDKWINLVYTYDNGTHKLYINGELRGTASNTINIGGTTNRYIGGIDANNGGYCMAECIFESVVWSADDVSAYYNKTKEIFYPSKEFVPSQNTLLYLPLENNVSDASGQSVARTLTTSGTSFTTVGGVQSLNVASTGGIKLTAPYPLQDNDKRNLPITVSMLIYVTSQSQSSRRTLFDIAATNGNRQWIVLYENTSNIRMQSSWGETAYATLTAPIIANQWMNIVYTITSSSTKLYVNGELKASGDGNPQGPWGNRPYSRDNTQGIFCTRDVNSYTSGLNGNARELIMEEVEWSGYDVLSYYNWIKEELGF